MLDIDIDTAREYIEIRTRVISQHHVNLYASTDIEEDRNYEAEFNLTFSNRKYGICSISEYDGLTCSTNGAKSIDVLRKRLKACIGLSPEEQQGMNRDHFVPTRLIEVKLLDSDTQEKSFRVVETRDLSIKPHYLTLSHRWGENPKLRLLTTNHKSLHGYMTWDEIPRTYADAFQLALLLGYNYVWVDALCIVQDDTKDWHAQAAEMGDVYRNTDMNIYASASTDENSGIFKRRDPTLSGITIGAYNWPGMLASYFDLQPTHYATYSYHRGRRTSQLGSRGWVLQEEFLAPAVAYFGGHGIFWACHHGAAGELSEKDGHACALEDEDGMLDPDSMDGYGLSIVTKRLFNPRSSTSFAYSGLSQRMKMILWRRIIEVYSECDLTYDRDKLSAISGIAQEVGKLLGWLASDYMAGMWKPIFLSELLWGGYYRDGVPAGVIEHPKEYVAPSWSWASLRGPVTLDLTSLGNEEPDRIEYISSLLAIHVSRSANAFGPVTGGFIVLKSQVWRLDLLQIKAANGIIPGTDGVFAMSCGHQVTFRLSIDVKAIGLWTPVFLVLRAARVQKRWLRHAEFGVYMNIDGLLLLPTNKRGEYPLLRYHSITQGEVIHISMWPPIDPFPGVTHQGLWSMMADGRQSLSQVYAVESTNYVLQSTAVCIQKRIDTWKSQNRLSCDHPGGGHSCIIGPDGRRLKPPAGDGKADTESIVYGDLDLAQVVTRPSKR
ncbi:hypothetical protein Hte_005582 [Hypoxylon texense]